MYDVYRHACESAPKDATDLERFVNSLTSMKHFKPAKPKSYLWFRGRSSYSLPFEVQHSGRMIYTVFNIHRLRIYRST